eukprot:TRINITY_DN5552_c0_g1_i1.p1 TRINITY_DN5552_c0_g1~~TRINITY_DN5552_c0_g1_i1.p1  ORF type:complete len:331 (+),score=84.27 TRINITY_DN5552_c0_g1_i1:260-1252(+)
MSGPNWVESWQLLPKDERPPPEVAEAEDEDDDDAGRSCIFELPAYERYHKHVPRRTGMFNRAHLNQALSARIDWEKATSAIDAEFQQKLDVYVLSPKDYEFDEEKEYTQQELLDQCLFFGVEPHTVANYNIWSADRYLEYVHDNGGYSVTTNAITFAGAYDYILGKAISATRKNKAARFSALLHLASKGLSWEGHGWIWTQRYYEPEPQEKLIRRMTPHLNKLWKETDETLGFVNLRGQSARDNCEVMLNIVADQMEKAFDYFSTSDGKPAFSWKPGKRAIENYRAKLAAQSTPSSPDDDGSAKKKTSAAKVSPEDGAKASKRTKTAVKQ